MTTTATDYAPTLANVEARNYTYCSATYESPLTFRKFLVFTPSKPEAQRRALAYARARWGEPKLIHVYPRNYLKQARALLAAGDHDGGQR